MKLRTEELTNKVLKLRKQGMTYRAIQKELGFSSSSMVDYYLKKSNKEINNWIEKLVIFPKRLPATTSVKDSYICCGWNAYRDDLIEKLKQVKEEL